MSKIRRSPVIDDYFDELDIFDFVHIAYCVCCNSNFDQGGHFYIIGPLGKVFSDFF